MTAPGPSFYEQLLDAAPDALVAVDAAGRICLVNGAAERLFGRPRSELLGAPLDLLGPARCRDDYVRLLADEAIHTAELIGLRRDGTECSLQLTCSRVATDLGSRLVLALRDVSDQRQIEAGLRARARQQALVAELGRRALTGIDLDQLMNEAVGLVTTDLGAEHGSLLELLLDGQAVVRAGVGRLAALVGQPTAELRAGTPAGQVVLEQTPVCIEDLDSDPRVSAPSLLRDLGLVGSLSVPLYGQERPLGVLGVHTATRRRFTTEDVHFVQAVANVAATALERRSQEERRRGQQMLRVEQMMAVGQVAAGVAHELRNPLTSIKGLVQVNLRERSYQGLPADDLAVIDHEIRRMERTLQTFLDFARPPQPDRRRLDLVCVVERVLALVSGRARKQQVVVRLLGAAAPRSVEADQDQLQQLLLNLVLNALDALPHGGTVEVDLRPPRDRHVEVHVRDTGPGIAPHILPRVFETFVSSKETGVGLGLPVSRRIAEDHGGGLSAFNLPEGGACFVLRLPALDDPAPWRSHADAAGGG